MMLAPHDLLGNLWLYNDDPASPERKFRLADGMNNLEGMMLCGFLEHLCQPVRETRTFALAYPTSTLQTLPVLAFLAGYVIKRDVLVLPLRGGNDRDDPFERHQRYYSLLAIGPQGELFASYAVPSGIMRRGDVDFTTYLPLVRDRRFRARYVETLREKFQGAFCPKVLFWNEKDIRRVLQLQATVKDDGKKIVLGLQRIRVGAILVEGAERLFFSDYRYREFLRWAASLSDSGMRLFLHFSNPWSPVIERMEQDEQTLLIRLTPQFLRLNARALSTCWSGTNAKTPSFVSRNLISMPTADKPALPMSIYDPCAPAGNLYVHRNEITQLAEKLRKVDFGAMVSVYARLMGLARYCLDILVPGPQVMFGFFDPLHGDYKLRSATSLVAEGKQLASRIGGGNGVLFARFCDELNAVLLELEGIRRSGGSHAFPTLKLEGMLKIAGEGEEGEYIIAPFVKQELGVLRDITTSLLSPECRIDVVPLELLEGRWFDRSGSTLLLPGPVSPRFLSELMKPYRSVVYFPFDGEERQKVLDQIELLTMVRVEDYWKCLVGVRRANVLAGKKFGTVISGAEEAMRQLVVNAKALGEEGVQPPVALDALLGKIRERVHRASESDPLLRAEAEADQRTRDVQDRTERVKHTVELTVREHDGSGEERVLRLDADHAYLYMPPDSVVLKELFPAEMGPGGLVAIIDEDERRDLLSLIQELYDIGQPFDANLVNSWKERLREHIADEGKTKARLYEEYARACEALIEAPKVPRHYVTVCTWARGEVIAPEDPKDLMALGIVMDSEELINNAETIFREAEKVRRLHREIGHKIGGIVRALIDGREAADLSYEELLLRSKIRLYETVSIGRESHGS